MLGKLASGMNLEGVGEELVVIKVHCTKFSKIYFFKIYFMIQIPLLQFQYYIEQMWGEWTVFSCI